MKLFNASGCLSREAVLAWTENTLSPAHKLLVEKHLHECGFCKEAFEGLSELSSGDLRRDFADLNSGMQQKLLQASPRKTSRKLLFTLAAAIALLLVGVFTVFRIQPKEEIVPVAQSISQPEINSPTPETPIVEENKKLPETVPSKPVAREREIVKKEVLPEEVAEESDLVVAEAKEEAAPESLAPEPEKKQLIKGKDKTTDFGAQPPAPKMRSFFSTEKVTLSENSAMAGKDDSETTFYQVEEQPEFEGGDLNKFREYVEEKLNHRQVSAGKITLSFIVDKSGTVKDAFLVKGIDAKTDTAVLDIIKNSPEWTPARNQGKTVNMGMMLQLEIDPGK
ncbi:MAG TPA: energy transducer TonB [Bacteroidales bacterium]|nr:energy transducer TonB [Bacteroidales bacterium]